METPLQWFVMGTVLGPVLGYGLLAVWLWVSDRVRALYTTWRRKRGPQ